MQENTKKASPIEGKIIDGKWYLNDFHKQWQDELSIEMERIKNHNFTTEETKEQLKRIAETK